MTDFAFVGRLPASKSILNRLHVVKSWCPRLEIRGDSDADDVRLMREGLVALDEGRDVDVGAAGTTLRFLALRASRLPGKHRLFGHARLFARPQDELIKILAQLGVRAELGPTWIEIRGEGWVPSGDTLMVPADRSSQFATAVLMNAWDLPFDLFVSLGGARVSEGYWRMSVRLAETLGMKLQFWDSDFRVPRGSRVVAPSIEAEIDVSSAFAIAALAAVAGRATLTDFPRPSLQPDAGFVEILRHMGVAIGFKGSALEIERASRLNGVRVNLKTMPDLFPVLAVLCGLAHGESHLYGAPHLVHKESDRLHRIAALLRSIGREVRVNDDGLEVLGDAPPRAPGPGLAFDCDRDHRLAFAAATLRAAGFDVDITDAEVVTKSFPEYWSVVGWQP